MSPKSSAGLAMLALAAFLMSAGVTSTAAVRALTPEETKNIQIDVDKRKALLEEYHQGKRGDEDGYVLLMNLLLDYGLLGKKGAPEVKQWKGEFSALEEKHPEYAAHPPNLIREQREVIEKEHQRQSDLAEKAKASFRLKDTHAFQLFGYGHRAVAQYQHHLDFYDLPRPFILKPKTNDPRFQWDVQLYDTGKNEFLHHEKISQLGIKPSRVLTFRHRIQLSLGAPAKWRFLWVCDDLLTEDDGSDEEESAIMRMKFGSAGHRWLDDTAMFKEFCGAFDLDGNMVYQLPLKQHPPDTVFEVDGTSRDGGTVLISVGEEVNFDRDDGGKAAMVRRLRKAILWTYPDKLESYDAKDAIKANAAIKAHGLRGRPWPWY